MLHLCEVVEQYYYEKITQRNNTKLQKKKNEAQMRCPSL